MDNAGGQWRREAGHTGGGKGLSEAGSSQLGEEQRGEEWFLVNVGSRNQNCGIWLQSNGVKDRAVVGLELPLLGLGQILLWADPAASLTEYSLSGILASLARDSPAVTRCCQMADRVPGCSQSRFCAFFFSFHV